MRARLVLTLLWPALMAATPDAVQREADRLTAQAAARGDRPGGAVDLIRLDDLGDWLPTGEVEARLRAAGRDAKRAPLVRAVAWWLLRHRALARLDTETVAEARAALGLIDGFAMRSGPAPHPTAPLDAADFRPYPDQAGAGELWLDAFLRPERETQATLVTRLVAEEETPAVLRLGYDDAVTVWLNADEVYVSPAAHPAWLDQAAIPIRLRAGDNRLVIEVRQRSGAWRLIARLTDAAGEPLSVEASPDPWGPSPDAAEGPPPEEVAHLWPELLAAADADPPVAADLRDLADYARVTGLPDADQAMPRVAIEGAFEDDPGPRSLLAWLRVVPDAERARVAASHAPVRPINEADLYAERALRLDQAWTHFYARRHREAAALVADLMVETPPYPPAWRLRATLTADLGLPHQAAALLAEARERWPDRPALDGAWLSLLEQGGRVLEVLAELERRVAAGPTLVDDRYRLALLRAARGDEAGATALLDAVAEARPELWTFALEAANIRLAAGHRDEALDRLAALWADREGDPTLAERLGSLYVDAGRTDEAQAVVEAALRVDPGDAALGALHDRVGDDPGEARLGPPIAELAALPSVPGVAAQVLYHHARAEVGADGLAVRRVRRVIRVLTDEGARRYGDVELSYVPGRQRLEIERARLLRADAPAASPARGERDLSDPDYRLYYDLRAEVLTFARPQPGDLIEVAWRLTDTDPDPAFPGYYGELAYLQEVAPRAISVVEVAGAAAERLQVEVVAPGLDVTRDGLRFEAHDVPGVPVEVGMPGASSVRAYVHISSAADWADVDRRYRALLDARDTPTEALAQQARVWAGDATTPEAIVRRLAAHVAHEVRYVGLEFGVHSFKPELPAETLGRGYGDCKDKATLLIALLRALDVEAHLTLVRTRASGQVAKAPASLAIFDHAVVYVPALDRFVDPTVDRNDPWTLPPSDQGAMAFVVGHSTEPVTIPAQPAAVNHSDWRFEVQLEADRRAKGELIWTTTGHPATVARRALEAEGAQREIVEHALAERFPGAHLGAPTLTGLTPALDPVEVRAPVDLPSFAARDDGLDVPVGGAPWHLVRLFAEAATRRLPLEIDVRRVWRQTLVVQLPPSARVKAAPRPQVVESRFGKMTASSNFSAGQLTTHAEWTLTAARVEPADYGAFREWLAAADRALEAPVEVHLD
ncbi:MAG: DUF3857 domain-containing protein [Myxococcales bacterium]|nr:DUF3857 domain-containing protein [Myxococcales bacterium]